ncbi:DUF4232 domain-containing protein [Streptomyces radicis]|nr:DUF4232 domain-containing protein [Streptomyces radicis]
MRPRPPLAAALTALALFAAACGTERAADRDADAGAPAAAPAADPALVVPDEAESPGPPPCPEEGLRLSAGQPNAAMGLREQTITLVNCGTEPRTVSGYPALTVLDAEHRPQDVKLVPNAEGITTLETTVEHVDATPEPVTLSPGEHAVLSLIWRNTVEGFDVPVEGVHLEIAPMEDLPAHVLTPKYPLDIGTTGELGVTPWQAFDREAP